MPETIYCAVCGQEAPGYTRQASWGPITLYYHAECGYTYDARLAPRLRDALVHALDRWKQRSQP